MNLGYEISAKVRKALNKLAKKDKALAIAVRKKISQIVIAGPKSIKHYKNLRGNMSHLKRVHIGSFVLSFQVRGDTIIFEDFAHHDIIYKIK